MGATVPGAHQPTSGGSTMLRRLVLLALALGLAPALTLVGIAPAHAATEITITLDPIAESPGGEEFPITGTVTTTQGDPVDDVMVLTYRSTDGGTTWEEWGAAVTGVDGTFVANDVGEVNARYRIKLAPDQPDYLWTQSVVRVHKVRYPVTVDIDASETAVTQGEAVTITGTVTRNGEPAPGVGVRLRRTDDIGSTTVGEVTADETGAVSLEVTPTSTGDYHWAVGDSCLPEWCYSNTASETVHVEVAKAVTKTSLTIATTRTTLTAGQPVTLGTRVTDGFDDALTGATVHLQRSVDGGQSWTSIGQATTDHDGRAKLTIEPKRNARYRWKYAGTDLHLAGRSAGQAVDVRRAVTLSVADTTIRRGGTVKLSGRVTPGATGMQVTLYRYLGGGRKIVLTRTQVRADGTYAISRVLSATGTYQLGVTVPATGSNLAGVSVKRTVTVG